MKLKADSTGKLAIYDETVAGDAPFTTPLANLGAVRFHSDLLTPAVVSVNTYSVTLPAMSAGTFRDTTITLAAHGRPGTPMVMGRIQNGSGWVPLNGSVLLPNYALDGSTSYRLFGSTSPSGIGVQGAYGWRSITLGADTTNILVHEYSTAIDAGSAQTLTIEVVVFDVNMDAPNPNAGTDPAHIHMSQSLVSFQRGKWRSDRRYIRTPAPSPTHYMPIGKTIEVGPQVTSSGGVSKGICHAGPVKFRWSGRVDFDITFDAAQQAVKV